MSDRDRRPLNLVALALQRPFSVIVAVIGLVLLALFALARMPRDIFPSLGGPVLYVAQPYGGMDPGQMEGYVTYYYEYHFLYLTGIEHVESKSIQGVSLLKLQFHPGTDMAQAMAETIAQVNRARAFMPPGTLPPFVMRFDAGSVPVGNLVFSSGTHTVGELQDAALNRVRPLFATLPGVSAPPPFGGSARSIVVRVDPDHLRSRNLTPDDVVRAIASANVLTPSGNIRIGDQISMAPLNAVVRNVKELENVPLRLGVQAPIFVRDVAKVEDATDIATGYALVNGRRTVYIPVTKRADASTLSVVSLVRENLPKFRAVLPDGMEVSYEFDQSPYVLRAMRNLATEGALGAVLTGLMVVLFLRDFRSALVVVINIPLALLASVIGLWSCGQTINLMTLGGLALAVGVLVDEAAVTVENIHVQRSRGKPVALAALDATRETAGPRLLAMLSVVSVFLPAFLMTGAVRALFVPLSLAVGFAMAASYLLSTTLVPVLAAWLMPEAPRGLPDRPGIFARFQSAYGSAITALIRIRWLLVPASLALALVFAARVGRGLGTEIFPHVDTGQFQWRLRAPAGTRIERTEVLTTQALEILQSAAGSSNIAMTLGFVGVQPPSFPVNTIHLWTGGPEEAVLQVQLKPGCGVPVAELEERLRRELSVRLPELRSSFEPGDIVSRVMSFGSPTPVEIAIAGPNLIANREFAEKIRGALAGIPALRDLQFPQTLDSPTLEIQVDRERAGMLGVTVGDVARSLVPATSSSRFTTPVYWADPASGVAYQVQVEVPQARMNSAEELRNVPVGASGGEPRLLRSVATVRPGTAVGEYDRYNMQRQVSLAANYVGTDLGSVGRAVRSAIASVGAPPARVSVQVRGQLAPLDEMLESLRLGLLLTVVVVFLLLTASFQSWKLSFIVISTVPAVLAGVAVALWFSRGTLNLQSFMGAVMAVGVAVANAILLVTFAEKARLAGATSAAAAAEGASSRLRPILMTSLAMISGMVPMALGLGEGGEQSAPLGMAVVGGLLAATFSTLLILPAVFALVQSRAGRHSASLDPLDPGSRHYLAQPHVP